MPKYPKKKLAQLVLQSCVSHQVDTVVISPGSRNAPLTLGFVNHPEVKTFSIVDERCAAFFALGMAQQLRKPIALLCTSGSALLNYFPAIAEAFYSKIPLVIISADRPKHLIDIGDGQTIRQDGVFNHHVWYEANLESCQEHSQKDDFQEVFDRNANLIDMALSNSIEKKGPVHINVPFDEPLYETVGSLYDFADLIVKPRPTATDTLLDEAPIPLVELENFASEWNKSLKKMVLIGSNFPDDLLDIQMQHLIKDPSVVILTETTSNQRNDLFINCIDQLIFPLQDADLENFKPDILLTFGGMIVSKKIKQFLRNHQPKSHWHVDRYGAMDTYFCLNKHFPISPQLFFSQFFFLTENQESTYQKEWLALKKERRIKHESFLDKVDFSDLKVFDLLLNSLPEKCNLQLANSSIVRYAQLFDLDPKIPIFCNRGASGIDGSTSTAIGASLIQEGQTVLITGDISFFYDSNGLWNKYIPSNFRIIVVNNSGGGIFKFIPGPKSSDALDYFETSHQYNASQLCRMFDFNYFKAENEIELKKQLTDFYKPADRPSLLEVFTPSATNDLILKDYFKQLS